MEGFGPRALFLHMSVVWLVLFLFGLWRLRARPPVAMAEQAELVPTPRGGTMMFELDPRTEDPAETVADAPSGGEDVGEGPGPSDPPR